MGLYLHQCSLNGYKGCKGCNTRSQIGKEVGKHLNGGGCG